LQPAVDDTREGAYGRTDCELARQVEVGVQARKEAEIEEQTYYRWRKEYGALKVNQARRSKELKQKHAKLKCLVSELSLEKQVLRDIASLTAASPSAALLCIRPR
jgi:hypothetical protein